MVLTNWYLLYGFFLTTVPAIRDNTASLCVLFSVYFWVSPNSAFCWCSEKPTTFIKLSTWNLTRILILVIHSLEQSLIEWTEPKDKSWWLPCNAKNFYLKQAICDCSVSFLCFPLLLVKICSATTAVTPKINLYYIIGSWRSSILISCSDILISFETAIF